MPCHILLVEDNPGDVGLIRECLLAQGIEYQLTHCSTADDAIRIVNTYGTDCARIPDLMLLDYNIPRGDACSVLDAARGNPALACMPRAVVTSSVAPDDRREALQFGADCFIHKPADLDAFLDQVGGKISELLKGSRNPVQG